MFSILLEDQIKFLQEQLAEARQTSSAKSDKSKYKDCRTNFKN
jgi:hypothetical protein